jgi:serine protease Do
MRKGESKTLTVALGTAPNTQQANASEPQRKQARTVPHLGLAVAPAAEVAGSGDKGVVVTAIDPGGAAAEHGLQNGDVILDVAGNAVNNSGDVRKALSEAEAEGKHDVLMRVKSAQAMRFVAVPIG